jgi:hypothetical protein
MAWRPETYFLVILMNSPINEQPEQSMLDWARNRSSGSCVVAPPLIAIG